MMRMNFGVTNPHETELTAQITMKLGDWIRLSEQLCSDYPSWKIGEAIGSMVKQARKNFIPIEYTYRGGKRRVESKL